MRLRPMVLMTLLAAVGCGDDGAGRPVDSGPQIPDGSRGTADDLDGDGLCNLSERDVYGTDPLVADTDGDGYPDREEAEFGYDPLVPTSPADDEVHILRENASSSVQVAFDLVVSGSGEEYAGAFDALEVVDLADQDAATFYRGSVATFADPPDNVAELDASAETFRGVVGRTVLGFEVYFEYGEALTRGCIRGYPFQYTIKRQDGVRVARFQELVQVMPPGESLAADRWCVPEGGCI